MYLKSIFSFIFKILSYKTLKKMFLLQKNVSIFCFSSSKSIIFNNGQYIR